MRLIPHKSGSVHLGGCCSAPGGFSVHDPLGRHVSTAYFVEFVDTGARYSVRVGRDTLHYVLTIGGDFIELDAPRAQTAGRVEER